MRRNKNPFRGENYRCSKDCNGLSALQICAFLGSLLKGSSEAHSKLVNEVLLILGSSVYCRVWKSHTGALPTLDSIKRAIRVAVFSGSFSIAWRELSYLTFGLPGSADISGILKDGRRLEIECKTGNAKQSKQQKKFQEMIEKFGGVYILTHSSDFLLYLIKQTNQGVKID